MAGAGTLLAGLGVASAGLLVESARAFGYADAGYVEANGLTVLHDIGVAMWPMGFVLIMAGAIVAAGVALATRLGVAGSWVVAAATVLAVTAAAAFVVGSFLFGY
jgi:hypothetical protein